jgi:membrane associated rhomboid family serine protease
MLHDFRPIFLTFLILLALSLTTYIIYFAYPALNEVLAASSRTPWGVVTSIFVHGGFEHLWDNLLFLFLYMLLFCFSNFLILQSEKRKRVSFSLTVIFMMAVISNLIWVVFVPNTSVIGSSGIVYAFMGVLMGFSLLNSLEILNLKRCDKKNRKYLLAMVVSNLCIFLMFFLQILSSPQTFLNVAPKVNSSIHDMSFLGGFFLTMFWYGIRLRRNAPKTPIPTYK